MRSSAAAFAWEFRRRHRWGLGVITLYLLVLLGLRLLVFKPDQMDLDDEITFAFMVTVPLSFAVIYFLVVFSFGLSGDLAARQSIYPSRMFTLPVTTAALAGWPMLYGTTAMVLLWVAARTLVVWPLDVHVPLIWPALLGASFIAWTQVLAWMPWPFRGLRVIAIIGWLTVFEAIIIAANELRVSETVMLALLAPHVPLAWLAARFAVGRARRGDGSGVGVARLARSRRRLAAVRPTRRDRFRSPDQAQTWFEWRRHGRALPALVAFVLPFELALLFLFNDVPLIVFEVLVVALLTPPFMAIFVGATVSRSDSTGNPYGITPFTAIRPLSDAALIAAKLRMATRSTVVAWVLVLLAIPIGLELAGGTAIPAGWLARTREIMGTPRAVTLLMVVLALMILTTWKQLVQSLCVGMSGREWLVKGSVFFALAVLAVIIPLGQWTFTHHAAVAALWDAFPWILVALVCIKLTSAGWIAVRLHEQRLITDRMLILGAACWTLSVFAFYGLLKWMLPALLFRGWFLALIAILAVPLARLAAAPLALAWNRHG